MFAVIRTGGKQYRVQNNDIIVVEKLLGNAGDKVKLDDVLLLDDSTDSEKLGKAFVEAEILEQKKGDKVIIFKKKRRHNYRRKNGHRQQITVLKVLNISA